MQDLYQHHRQVELGYHFFVAIALMFLVYVIGLMIMDWLNQRKG